MILTCQKCQQVQQSDAHPCSCRVCNHLLTTFDESHQVVCADCLRPIIEKHEVCVPQPQIFVFDGAADGAPTPPVHN